MDVLLTRIAELSLRPDCRAADGCNRPPAKSRSLQIRACAQTRHERSDQETRMRPERSRLEPAAYQPARFTRSAYLARTLATLGATANRQ